MSQKSNNDNHANQKNPNSAAHKAGRDNRANQKNPNHAPTKGGKKQFAVELGRESLCISGAWGFSIALIRALISTILGIILIGGLDMALRFTEVIGCGSPCL